MGTACETWARICIQIPLWINKCTNKETNAKCSWGHALDSQICFHAQQFYTEGSQVQHVIALFLPKGSTTFYVISSTIFCGCFTHNCLLVFSKPIYFYFLSSSCFFYRCSSSSLSPNVIKLFFYLQNWIFKVTEEICFSLFPFPFWTAPQLVFDVVWSSA